jgi:poly(A) polymerase
VYITARSIVETLQSRGHKAYWAGGCVRDMLLNIKPKDFDIVTSAKPEEIESLFEKTVPIGKKFGVILAIIDGHHFEIATFRSDAASSDGRRPDAILFTSAEQDATRRDFTINALFYDPIADKIYDYVGGQKDLEQKLIRFIGDPQTRISEDYLRILRAVRMKNTFQFQYHPDTYAAVKQNAGHITKISAERIADELNKMILSPHPQKAFEEMEDTGLLQHIVPEMLKMKGVAQPEQYHQEGDVWEHAMRSIESLRSTKTINPDPKARVSTEPLASLEVHWAVILHDIGKPDTFMDSPDRIRFNGHAARGAEIARDILTRLKFPRRMIEHVSWLIVHHMMMVQLLEMPKHKRLQWFHHPLFLELMEVFRADACGTVPIDLTLHDQILALYRSDLAETPYLPRPLLSGHEIMDISGLPPGPRIGQLGQLLHEKQLAGEITTKDEAMEWLKKEH